MGLTQDQLAQATGYTAISIYWFERGETPPQRNAKGGNPENRDIKDWVFLRYQNACGNVDAEMFGRKQGEKFKW